MILGNEYYFLCILIDAIQFSKKEGDLMLKKFLVISSIVLSMLTTAVVVSGGWNDSHSVKGYKY